MWWMIAAAAAGGISGGVSTWQQSEREKAALEQQKRTAWKQYQLGRQHSDEQFGIQKSAAMDQMNAQRRGLDAQVNLSINDYNTALLAQAFGKQDARIQTGSDIGASMAAEGAGGTRGNAANEMVRAYAGQSLERNIGVQDRQNKDYLDRMITGANLSVDAIERERMSWQPGGYKAREKDAQDTYNLGIARLGESDFDWQIDQINDPTNRALNYMTGILSGASSGMSMGSSISSYKNAWYDTGKK